MTLDPNTVRDFRKRRKLSQGDLGEMVGVSQAVISRIETGISVGKPVLMLLEKIIESESIQQPNEAAE